MSKIEINADFINDIISKVMQAAESGLSLDVNDGDEVGKYVCAILALGAELIPVVGEALGAFISFLGAIFFSPMSMEKIWDYLRERIEALIDAKIAEYHLKTLKQKILGLQDNMTVYRQYLRDWKNATGADKDKAATTLHNSHVAFSAVVLAAIPEFQVDDYAVASLPMFALVANMYLALLVDGIKQGEEWGYSPQNIQSMMDQFRSKTTPQDSKTLNDDYLSHQKSALEEAIKAGPELGVPANVLDTWREAYAVLFEPGKDPKSGNEGLDYVSYSKKIYTQGRSEVKPYSSDIQTVGGDIACEYRAYADYDTSMIMNVLNYAELWPFMTGDPITESALKNLDREIFFGPYGRYAYHASWDPSTPPPVNDRGLPITGLIIRGWDAVDGIQIKQGDTWGSWQGSSTGGAPQQLDLAADEWIESFDILYGQKLVNVKLSTNKGHSIENGDAVHGGVNRIGAPPGYEMTSIIITNYESHIPPGCEGIIFGFRSLMTDSSRG
ncbi:hypothetical protein M426DRAFT_265150 [Hypoxylon sp. CI-4A]|nr:hypothetical protein M426DRAFT_265150 [Hypoxylon sp. CI-4A]